MTDSIAFAESRLIGGALLSSDRLSDVVDKVAPADFLGEMNGRIWESMQQLDAGKKPIDVITVSRQIEHYCKSIGVDARTVLSVYRSETMSTGSMEHYAEMVHNAALERRMVDVGSEIVSIVKGEGSTKEKLDQAQSAIMALLENRESEGPKPASGYIAEYIADLEVRNNSQGMVGISTGIKHLDEITAGLQKTDLIIVAGRPSMGKTTLAMNFAEESVFNAGANALVFSLEMSATQLINRMVSSIGGVPADKLRIADLEESEWQIVTTTTGRIIKSGLIIDESPGLTIMDIRSRARRVHRKTPLDLIVVDYIQLMDGEGENQNQIVSRISRGLKALAKELSVPVVALSQLNRQVDSRADKRPVMSDLRESGAIEQDADVIMFVYRDRVYNENSPYEDLAEIIIRKQRNGRTGTVDTEFQGRYCRFKNHFGRTSREIQADLSNVKPIKQRGFA